MMGAGMPVCFHHHVNSYYNSLSNFSSGGINRAPGFETRVLIIWELWLFDHIVTNASLKVRRIIIKQFLFAVNPWKYGQLSLNTLDTEENQKLVHSQASSAAIRTKGESVLIWRSVVRRKWEEHGRIRAFYTEDWAQVWALSPPAAPPSLTVRVEMWVISSLYVHCAARYLICMY